MGNFLPSFQLDLAIYRTPIFLLQVWHQFCNFPEAWGPWILKYHSTIEKSKAFWSKQVKGSRQTGCMNSIWKQEIDPKLALDFLVEACRRLKPFQSSIKTGDEIEKQCRGIFLFGKHCKKELQILLL